MNYSTGTYPYPLLTNSCSLVLLSLLKHSQILLFFSCTKLNLTNLISKILTTVKHLLALKLICFIKTFRLLFSTQTSASARCKESIESILIYEATFYA